MDVWDVLHVFVAVFLSVVAWHYLRKVWISEECKGPPGPPYIPLFSPVWTLLVFLRDGIWGATAAYAARYGGFVRVWLGNEPTYIISSAPAAAHVLKSSNYRSRFGDPSGLAHIGMHRQGVIFNNDVRSWKNIRFFFVKANVSMTLRRLRQDKNDWFAAHCHRQLISYYMYLTALYKEVLDRAAGVSATATRQQLANIRDTASSNPDGAVDVITLMRRITLEIGNRLFLGVNIENDLEVVNTINGYFAAWEFFMIRPKALQLLYPGQYRKHMAAVKALRDVVRTLVEKKRACMDGDESEEEFSIPKGEHDFAAALIQAQESGELSAACVRQCVTEMLIAGPDTMSVNIYFILLHIAEHGLEDRIVSEIREVVGDRDPTREDLNKMAFLDHVINESMRTRPVVTFVMRRAEEDDHLDGYYIPKGANVIVNLVAVHQDPRHFPEPEKFDTDHFKDRVPSTQFMPFGLGVRACVGRTIAPIQMKAVLITLLRMYRLCPSRDHKSLDVSRNLSEHPTEPGYMFLYPRSNDLCL